jgi:glycosyltransferase involved in cell wall biosynthesis
VGVDVELVMTGTAGTWVGALARRYGAGQEFLGRLPEGEHFWLMAGARATVLPSVWPEHLGLVAVESIDLGVPVVGSSGGRGWVWRLRCQRRWPRLWRRS